MQHSMLSQGLLEGRSEGRAPHTPQRRTDDADPVHQHVQAAPVHAAHQQQFIPEMRRLSVAGQF